MKFKILVLLFAFGFLFVGCASDMIGEKVDRYNRRDLFHGKMFTWVGNNDIVNFRLENDKLVGTFVFGKKPGYSRFKFEQLELVAWFTDVEGVILAKSSYTWKDREADIGEELKFTMDMPEGYKKFVYVTFGANADGFTPISDQTQRLEFKGFSILPPRATGWIRLNMMEQQKPKVFPNMNARAYLSVDAYFIKWLSVSATNPSDLHRLTAVVRTINVDDLKVEDSVGFLKEMADGFSGETFLDKCFGQDCFRYQSTSEHQNPKFPNSVFLISKHGFVVSHPTSSTLFIMMEYRQYYAKGVRPLSAEAWEKEVEPFQNSLKITSISP